MGRVCFLLLILMFLSSCRRSVDSCRRDAESTVSAMQRQLAHVQTRQDLKTIIPRLRRHYLEIARLMVAVDRAYERDDWLMPEGVVAEAVERLRLELIRVYEIPDAREMIEQAQEVGLRYLERNHQALKR